MREYDPNRSRAPWSTIEADVVTEARRWGAKSYRVASGCDGRHRNMDMPKDERWAEVELTFRDKPPVKLHVDRFESANDNLKAILLGMNAIRLNEARGLGDVFRSFYNPNQLTAGALGDYDAACRVIGVTPDSPMSVKEAAHRAAAKAAHPDHGGNNAAMARVNEAWEVIKRGAS